MTNTSEKCISIWPNKSSRDFVEEYEVKRRYGKLDDAGPALSYDAMILMSFFMIAGTYLSIQIPFDQRNMEAMLERNQVLLHALVERDREWLANELFERRMRAL